MQLAFLAPLFLAGLLALAVPVLVHLTHRERKEPIRFPSLMFLERVPYRTQHRQRIRHWLLFLLRVGAVVLIVTAFARPLLDGGPVGVPAAAPARDVVVLLDRSASMEHGDRWQRAVAAARDALTRLGPADRVTLIVFADAAEVAGGPAEERETIAGVLPALTPGAGGTAYGPALQLAGDLLEDGDRARELVLITDFQHGAGLSAAQRLPAGTRVTTVDVGGEAANGAVTGVLLDRTRDDGRPRVRVAARITSFGADAPREVPVYLELDGQRVQSVTVSLPAAGDAVARFPAIADPDRPIPARVTMPRDDLPGDDTWHFVLHPVPQVPVLLVSDAAPAARETLYLSEALGVGYDPAFPVITRRPAALDEEVLEHIRVAMLHGVPFPGGRAGRALLEFVRGGGGLFVALGPGTVSFPPALADSVGQPAQQPASRLEQLGATAGITDYQHPLFTPFRGPESGDLTTARIYRYREITPRTATVLARLDDGAPALVEGRFGAGRVLVWTSDLGNRWNDLPLRAVFVPLVQSVARYLGGYTPVPASWSTGREIALDRLAPDRPERLVLEAPDGARRVVDPSETSLHVDRRGLYLLRPPDDRTTPVALVAVNGDPAESDLTRLDPDALVAAIRPLTDAAPATGSPAGGTPADRERRQRLWWYLLMGAVVLLMAETAVAHRTRRTA